MISKLKTFLFNNLTPHQTIAKNIFWLSISQVGSRFFKAIIIIYAARVLGASEYGIFAYVLGLTGFFSLFVDIGVNAMTTREIASHPDKKDEYFLTSSWIKFFLLLISAFLVIFAAPHFSKISKANVLFPLMALIVVFDGIGEFINAFFRGMEKMEWEALVATVKNTVIMVAGFIFITISPTSKSLVFSYIASLVFATLLAISIIIKNKFIKPFRYFFNKKMAFEIINGAWPIALSAILGAFMLNTDVIMLGWWKNTEQIGYYSIGQRITGVLYVLPALLANAVFPLLSRLVKQNEKQREKILNEKTMAVIFLAVMPLIIGGIVLSQSVIKFIFGPNYLPATLSFQILIASLIWIFPGVFLSNIILAHDQQKKVVVYLVASAWAYICFNFFLIPIWGIVGASISTFVAQSIYIIPFWRRTKKISEFQTLRHLKKIIAAAIIMGGLSFAINYLKINVIINIFISGAAYFAMLYLAKEKILGEFLILFKKNRETLSE